MFVSAVAFSRRAARPPVRIDPTDYIDYFGRDCSPNIRLLNGRAYYVKPAARADEARLERLGYLLAKGVFNVPEIGPAAEISSDAAGRAARYGNRIRLCQDCDPERLPVKDLSRAVAAEIVFSAWINRRDAHSSNRWFLDGVPMFFDFNAAFGVRKGESALDFFRSGPDSGHVPNWRLIEVPAGRRLDTRRMRSRERGRPLAVQPVHSIGQFWAGVAEFAEVVSRYGDRRIERAVLDSGLDTSCAERVAGQLVAGRDRLGDRLRDIRAILSRSSRATTRSVGPARAAVARASRYAAVTPSASRAHLAVARKPPNE